MASPSGMQQINRRLQERIKSQEEHVLFLCPLFYPDDRKKGQGLRINERGLVSYPMLQQLLLPSSSCPAMEGDPWRSRLRNDIGAARV